MRLIAAATSSEPSCGLPSRTGGRCTQEPDAAGAALEWLRYAEDDLVLAAAGLTRRRIFQPRQVCFNAQQAAEKAIKALLVADQITFKFSHDLELLAGLLLSTRVVSVEVADLASLGQWATATRYPGDDEPTWADAVRAVEVADAVLTDVRASLGSA
jgi:HEPN domain-containing protein